MKKNQLTFIFVGVFFLTTLVTVALALKFNSSLKKLQELNVTMIKMQNTENFLKHLYVDSVEYSKKDAAIIPLLQTFTNSSGGMEPPAAPK